MGDEMKRRLMEVLIYISLLIVVITVQMFGDGNSVAHTGGWLAMGMMIWRLRYSL
jgi:hypothetical protein